jgi:hypothetical protein
LSFLFKICHFAVEKKGQGRKKAMKEEEIGPFLKKALSRRFENDNIEYKKAKTDAPDYF